MHVISPREELGVPDALAGRNVVRFETVEKYRQAFGGMAGGTERPELLIVDVSTPPSAVDRRILIADVQRSHPEQEILVLVEAWRTDRIGYLLQHGIGNLLPGAFRTPSDFEVYLERLLPEAQRLLEVAAERRKARDRRDRGQRVLLPKPDRLVFLSQSRDAETEALGIRRFLEVEGQRVWFWKTDGGDAPQEGVVPYASMPERTPKPAEDFPELQAALKSAEIYVVVLSPEWLESEFCKEELETAEGVLGGLVLPVLNDRQLRSDERVRKLLDRWPAPYAMSGLGAQAHWAREQVLKRLR